MKKGIALILSLFVLTSLLCSCSTVYLDVEKTETTEFIDPDLGEEYFTKGGVYRNRTAHSLQDGYVHEGVWYYVEVRQYKIKTVTEEEGRKVISTSTEAVERIVKYNPITDTVTSPCLDPVCNHSVGSECIMLGPTDFKNGYIQIYDVIDDWMIIIKTVKQSFETQYSDYIAYNLKTGAFHEIYSEGLADSISTEYTGNSVWEGKMYIVKHVLDYSETGFKVGGDKPMSEYKPKTESYLYEYDIAANTQKQLFKIPAGANVNRITNKRFLISLDGEFFTCNIDGSDMQKSEVLDFVPCNKNGNYAYSLVDSKHIKVYDLKTDTVKNVTLTDLDVKGYPIFTDDGIMISTAFKGKAQIWKSDLEGENFEVIYEWDETVARYVGASGDYLFAAMADKLGGSATTPAALGSSRRCINIKTGENRIIPLLELPLPENAWME